MAGLQLENAQERPRTIKYIYGHGKRNGTECDILHYTPITVVFFNRGDELCIMKTVVDNSLLDTETLSGVSNSVIWFFIIILVIWWHIYLSCEKN